MLVNSSCPEPWGGGRGGAGVGQGAGVTDASLFAPSAMVTHGAYSAIRNRVLRKWQGRGGQAVVEPTDEVRQRYQDERAKRLRSDGLSQYHQLTEEYEEYDHDPWVEPGVASSRRKPRSFLR